MADVTSAPRPVAGLLERLLDEAEAASPRTDDSPASPSDTAFPSDPPTAGSTSPADPAPMDAAPSSPTSSVGSPPTGGSPVAALLTDPAVLSALPALMENLTPLLSGLGRGVGSSPSAARPHTVDRHTALLCALKPYLSPHRRETAETVIRLCRVWDALERSGISLTGLLGLFGNGDISDREGRDPRVQ